MAYKAVGRSLYQIKTLFRGGNWLAWKTISFFIYFQSQVEIKIADINDNDPEFTESSYTANIPEDFAEGQIAIKINATDKDEGLLLL